MLYSEVLFSVFVFVVYVIIIKSLHIFFSVILKKTSRGGIFSLILKEMNTIFLPTFFFIGLYVFFLHVQDFSPYKEYIDKIFKSILIVLIGFFIYRVVNILVEIYGHRLAKKTKTHIDDALISISQGIIRVVAWGVIIFEVLSIWGINLSPLLASAGIIGVAIAFAGQETMKNLFGGVSVSLDQSLKVGDWVILDNAKMKVLETGVRSTKFLTLDGTLKIYPNSKIAENVIENLSQPYDSPKKVKIKVSVAYGSDPGKVKEILREEAYSHERVMKDSVSVFMTEMGEYGIEFLLVCDVPSIDDVWPVKTSLVENIYKRLLREGIEIPYPTHTVYVRKEG